jgi:hypothetical protein
VVYIGISHSVDFILDFSIVIGKPIHFGDSWLDPPVLLPSPYHNSLLDMFQNCNTLLTSLNVRISRGLEQFQSLYLAKSAQVTSAAQQRTGLEPSGHVTQVTLLQNRCSWYLILAIRISRFYIAIRTARNRRSWFILTERRTKKPMKNHRGSSLGRARDVGPNLPWTWRAWRRWRLSTANLLLRSRWRRSRWWSSRLSGQQQRRHRATCFPRQRNEQRDESQKRFHVEVL